MLSRCEDQRRWLQSSSNTVLIRSVFPFVIIGRILYQRGIYPPENFNRVTKYGLSMVTARDESLVAYLHNMIRQVQCYSPPSFLLIVWLESNDLRSLIICIYGIDSQRVLERWSFVVETDREVAESNGSL